MTDINLSGHGISASIPQEINKWNWGAFLLTWIWGIGNNTFVALLVFLPPPVNIIMMFVLGAKGNSWTWQNKKWESIERFKTVQRKWVTWGLIVHAAFIVFFITLYAFFSSTVPLFLNNTDLYKMATTQLKSNGEVSLLLGKPISTEMLMGTIQVSGPSGNANISIRVKGSKSRGTLYIDAVKKLEKWIINEMIFEEDGTGHRITLKSTGDITT
ncbi:MAG: cytochrome c oxidase assembly factor Coa1 family protein [Chlorobiaceae bacterium]